MVVYDFARSRRNVSFHHRCEDATADTTQHDEPATVSSDECTGTFRLVRLRLLLIQHNKVILGLHVPLGMLQVDLASQPSLWKFAKWLNSHLFFG